MRLRSSSKTTLPSGISTRSPLSISFTTSFMNAFIVRSFCAPCPGAGLKAARPPRGVSLGERPGFQGWPGRCTASAFHPQGKGVPILGAPRRVSLSCSCFVFFKPGAWLSPGASPPLFGCLPAGLFQPGWAILGGVLIYPYFLYFFDCLIIHLIIVKDQVGEVSRTCTKNNASISNLDDFAGAPRQIAICVNVHQARFNRSFYRCHDVSFLSVNLIPTPPERGHAGRGWCDYIFSCGKPFADYFLRFALGYIVDFLHLNLFHSILAKFFCDLICGI